MKRNTAIATVLAIFALLAGYLLSGVSFVGRVGINLFYTEYKFLKTWWKGALLVYIAWMILYSVQSYLVSKSSKRTGLFINIASLIIAVSGLLLTYADFRNTISHRLLGERFHLGVYLFWLGWICISIYLLNQRKNNELSYTTTVV